MSRPAHSFLDQRDCLLLARCQRYLHVASSAGMVIHD